MEKRALIREIATEGLFIYEITVLCQAITLTRSDNLRKIRGIPKTKRKAADSLSAFHSGTRTANRHPYRQRIA
jgi:hypothetical protein